MLCKQLLVCNKFKFCFLALSGIFFLNILICTWLNPQMQNPRIQRADCNTVRSASWVVQVPCNKILLIPLSCPLCHCCDSFHLFISIHKRIYVYSIKYIVAVILNKLLSVRSIKNKKNWDFPGGAVIKNPPANAGDTGSSPCPGRSHMQRRN